MAERSPEFTQRVTPDSGRTTTMREQVRRGVEERPTPRTVERPEATRQPRLAARPEVGAVEKTSAQRATLSMGIASLAIGVLGFVAPAVTGNRDRVINRSNGKLLGIFAINPTHALVHTGLGVAGIAAQRSASASERYLQATAVAYAGLAAAGILKGRNQRKEIYEFMGMALNGADNVLHSVWSAASTAFAVRPQMLQGR